MKIRKLFCRVMALIAAFAMHASAATLYVDANATGNNTGTNWTDAFTALTVGLGFLADDDTLWVAEGVYVPGGFRAATFTIPRRVDVYGGFTNGMETLEERDWVRYPTILSGDALGNDGPNWSNREDNVYHVFHSAGDPFSFKMRLDGFIIRGGNADGGGEDFVGGGGYIQDSDQIVIANCVFTDNQGGGSGGLHLKRCEDAEIIDCVFSGNRAISTDSGYGSGALGGPIQNNGFPGYARRTFFTGNESAARGGVMYADAAAATPWEFGFENCVLAGNAATNLGGGALYLRDWSNQVANCTFTGNDPSAIHVQGAAQTYRAVNCILWGDSMEVATSAGNLEPVYCNIDQLGFDGGEGNIQEDPIWAAEMSGTWSAGTTFDVNAGQSMLTDAGAGWTPGSLTGYVLNPDTNQVLNFYVWSNSATRAWIFGDASAIAGLGDAYSLKHLALGDGSPSVDTGSNSLAPSNDVAGVVRPIGPQVDMGAYESATTGSVSGVIYADDTASGLNDGRSWLHAYTNLQDALADAEAKRIANPDDLTIQVWVAKGSYVPGSARADSFVLVHRVPTYGGFAGFESATDQRNIKSNPTILSGDLDGDDTPNWSNRSDNAYHVVADTNFTKQVVLDGFVVRGGNADGEAPTLRRGQGGGLFSEDSQDLTVRNCVFTDNSAGGGGGAMIRRPNGGVVTIVDCDFVGNRATEAGNDVGGAGLAGLGQGDGSDGTLTVERCIFSGNSAPGSIGGGAHLSGYVDGGPQGGGLDLRGTNAALQNCTITCNEPYGLTIKDAMPVGRNLIIWNNTAGAVLVLNQAFQLSYSDIDQDGFAGLDGNIRQNPLWPDSLFDNWTLAASYDASRGVTVLADGNASWPPGSFVGRVVSPDTGQPLKYLVCSNDATTITVWGDASQGDAGDEYEISDYHLIGRPCIDAGTSDSAPEEDLDSVIRPQGLAVDMGAFEHDGAIPFSNGVIYVDGDATGGNSGASWDNAFKFLANAIAAAPGAREIWVAEGSYYPGAAITDSFTLKPTVPVYGGFRGTETARAQRNISAYCTILCGDLQNNDAADDLSIVAHSNRSDNARHVVVAGDLTRLDGFTVVGGYAYHASEANLDAFGGGVLISGASPEIENCTFVDNFGRLGGAVAVLGAGAPAVNACDFSGNWGLSGGALFSQGSPSLDRCTFVGTETRDTGGAMYFEGASTPRVQNSVFSGNYSFFDGAIRINGGAGASNELELVNCTLADNTAFWNGAVYIKRLSQPVIWNCILWNNDATGVVSTVEIGIDAAAPQGSVDVSFSDVTGGYVGTGNLDADPDFVPAPTGTWLTVSVFDPVKRQTTFTVTGGTWLVTHDLVGLAVNPNTNQWKQFTIVQHSLTSLTVWGNAALVAAPGDPFAVKNYDLLRGSPCVDVGTATDAPSHDIGNHGRPLGGGFDMGAFEVAPLPNPSMIFMIF